jgi:hypothetical protein
MSKKCLFAFEETFFHTLYVWYILFIAWIRMRPFLFAFKNYLKKIAGFIVIITAYLFWLTFICQLRAKLQKKLLFRVFIFCFAKKIVWKKLYGILQIITREWIFHEAFKIKETIYKPCPCAGCNIGTKYMHRYFTYSTQDVKKASVVANSYFYVS